MIDSLMSYGPVIAALLVAGLLAGFLAGLLGIGGGIITVPVLFSALADAPDIWRMHMAIATSLAIIVVTNLSSIRAHHRRGAVDWALIRRWGPAVILGSLCGAAFAASLKSRELVFLFAGLAAFLSVKMLLPIDHWRLGTRLPGGFSGMLPPGLIGFFSAVLGIGGGSFSVPYMTLYGMAITRAVGTASLIGFVISLSGGAGYLIGGDVAGRPWGSLGFIHVPSVLIVAPAAALAAPYGAAAAHRLPQRALSLIFGFFLVAATARLLSSVL